MKLLNLAFCSLLAMSAMAQYEYDYSYGYDFYDNGESVLMHIMTMRETRSPCTLPGEMLGMIVSLMRRLWR